MYNWKIVVCKPTMKFCSREWLRRPGGQGGFRPPPYAPLDPLYPLQTAEGYPRTPPLHRYGHFPLSLDRQGPHRASRLVWPRASNQSGAGVGTHFTLPRCWGTYCGKVALPWRHLAITPRIGRRRGAGGGISCAEGDSGPPRDGREPSWARPSPAGLADGEQLVVSDWACA